MKARWAGYFERLYQADPPAVELDVRSVTAPLLTLQSTVVHLRLLKQTAVRNGVKLQGFVASMLNFSRLVEMLYLCHCMQFCALPGTQASSKLTGRGALFSLSGKGRVIARIATTTEG